MNYKQGAREGNAHSGRMGIREGLGPCKREGGFQMGERTQVFFQYLIRVAAAFPSQGSVGGPESHLFSYRTTFPGDVYNIEIREHEMGVPGVSDLWAEGSFAYHLIQSQMCKLRLRKVKTLG